MYRPNRIGPWPLVNLDRAPHSYGSLTGHQAPNVHSPITPDSTIRTETASRQFFGTITSLAAANVVTIGIALAGDNPLGDLAGGGDPGVLYSASGIMTLRNSAQLLTGPPVPQICRNDADTLATTPTPNAAANHQMLPYDAGAVSFNGFMSSCSFNTSFIIGNFDGSITYSSDPLILCWTYKNGSGTTVSIEFSGMLTFHKYLKDLDTLDSGRQ